MHAVANRELTRLPRSSPFIRHKAAVSRKNAVVNEGIDCYFDQTMRRPGLMLSNNHDP